MGGEAGVHTHYRSEQEEEEGVDGGDPGAQRFFMGFEKEQGRGQGLQAQAVFSRSCMAFCCVSFSVDTHCVHSPADTWGT